MTTPSDEGTVQALLERLNKIRLPYALALKAKVERGECLNDFDIEFLEEVFAEASSARSIVINHPELHELTGQLAALYHHITERALENERNRQP